MTEEVVTAPALSEHDQKMVDLADKGTMDGVVKDKAAEKEAPASERPEWLPPKFKTVDDFLNSYNELETKLGTPAEGAEITDQETAPSESEGEQAPEQQSKDIQLDEYYDEFVANGSLAEESYQKLDKMGFNKDIVDTYIRGYKAQVDAIRSEAEALVGGKEDYAAMETWASQNLSADEIKSFNAQLAGDKAQWELAIRGLHAKYLNSGQAPVERIRGESKVAPQSVQPFTSQAELTQATSSKEYKTSPEFRKKVEERLAVSDDVTMGAFIPHKYAAH